MVSTTLELSNIHKRYGNTVALRDVEFSCRQGEIHAILGENGAGKSTLIKVITGIVKADKGNSSVLGRNIGNLKPVEIIHLGLSTVYQELSFVPDLTVARNFVLASQYSTFLSNRAVNKLVQEQLQEFEIYGISANMLVRELSIGQRQQLEIARALYRKPEVLLLDEPTSALNPPEVEWLFSYLRQLKENGCSIVFISHRMDEIKGICDRITILRNGENAGTFNSNDVDNDTIIRAMLGKSLDNTYSTIGKNEESRNNEIAVELKNLSVSPGLRDISFKAYKGEIIGIAGLAGQGQIQLFSALYGLAQPSSGVININGKKVTVSSPRKAIANGIVYVPSDRGNEGLLLNLPVEENMALPVLEDFSKFGWIDEKRERNAVMSMAKQVGISITKVDDPARSLSGGNQQKVLLGKWLLTGAQVILLYDPTRGVDIGTKLEINTFAAELAKEGRTLFYYSTDVDELSHIADRIIVFYQGKIIAELSGHQINSEAVLAATTGHKKDLEAKTTNE